MRFVTDTWSSRDVAQKIVGERPHRSGGGKNDKKGSNNKSFKRNSRRTICSANHFMLHKAGLHTFYGQAFLPDICELDNEILPYTRKYFEELIRTGTIREIRPSEYWYEERKA